MTDLTLASQVLAAPNDMAPRRAYADAVRAQEPERAEFIDVQLEIREALRAGQEAPAAASARSRFLAHRFGRQWSGRLAGFVTADVGYYGGFVELVQLTPAQLTIVASVLVKLAPIRHLRMLKLKGKVDGLLRAPFLGQLASLDLGQSNLDDAAVIQLASCAALQSLQWLDLGDNPITPAALRALQALPKLRYVETEGSAAPLVERCEDDGRRESFFTGLRDELGQELGPLPWLETLDSPRFDTL